MRSDNNRKLYLTFGEDTFTLCHWCNEPIDYLTYYLPGLAAQYLAAFVLMGAMTAIFPNKAGFRNYFAWTILGAFALESLLLYGPEEYRNELLTVLYPMATKHADDYRRLDPITPEYMPPIYHTFFYARYAMFIAMLLYMLLKDSPDQSPAAESELLEKELARIIENAKKLEYEAYLRNTISLDPELHTIVQTDLQRRNDEYVKWKKSPEVATAIKVASQRINHADTVKKWQHRIAPMMAEIERIQRSPASSNLSAKDKRV